MRGLRSGSRKAGAACRRHARCLDEALFLRVEADECACPSGLRDEREGALCAAVRHREVEERPHDVPFERAVRPRGGVHFIVGQVM